MGRTWERIPVIVNLIRDKKGGVWQEPLQPREPS